MTDRLGRVRHEYRLLCRPQAVPPHLDLIGCTPACGASGSVPWPGCWCVCSLAVHGSSTVGSGSLLQGSILADFRIFPADCHHDRFYNALILGPASLGQRPHEGSTLSHCSVSTGLRLKPQTPGVDQDGSTG